MVKEIKQSLDKLSVDPNRHEDAPCIDPPELTLGHKIEGSILFAADGVINTTGGALANATNSVYVVGKYASGVGQKIAEVTVSTFSNIAQAAIHSTTAMGSSLFSAIGSLIGNWRTGTSPNNNLASTIEALGSTQVEETQTIEIPQPVEASQADSPIPNPDSNASEQGAPEPTINTGAPNLSQETVAETIFPDEASSTDQLAISPSVGLGGGGASTIVPEIKADEATTTEPAVPESTTSEIFSYVSEVHPVAPIDVTSASATTTFSGTYSNNSTFDTLVFELKNVLLDTATSSISRAIATTTGENLPYSEDLSLGGEGTWQYRVRLEDSITASSTPWSILSPFIFVTVVQAPGDTTAPPETETATSTHTLYTDQYIGTPIDVGGGWSSGSGVRFTSDSRAADVYSVRFKKSSDFDCRSDAVSGFIVSGFLPLSQRIAEFDIANATTTADGLYCEYPFTKDHISIPASIGLSQINFVARHDGNSAFLDGSYANNERIMGSDGIWRPAPTFAFQLCGIDGCDESFKLPPDGVTLAKPTMQTYLYSPTFSGTYNNNATFNKIVFEFKNLSLDTATSTLDRPISSNGSAVPYSEQIDVPTAGDWQYRAHLEDSLNASSTPWTPLSFFTFTPRTDESKSNARTVYAQPYTGERVDVSGGWTGNSTVTFVNEKRNEDAYSIRFKKASNFDCKLDAERGDIIYVWNGAVTNHVVTIDTSRGLTDGDYCEYPFTEDRTAIPASSGISEIHFYATHNGEHVYLDGSVENEGRAKNGYGINDDASYAFQLCNISGCNGSLASPAGGDATSTVPIEASSTPSRSSLHAITAFSFSLATTTIPGVIDEVTHTINLTVPFGTSLQALTPIVTVSPLATSSPASLAVQDFTNPVLYTITAEDGSSQIYTVTVLVAPDTATHEAPPDPISDDSLLPLVTGYMLNGVAGDITADFATTTPTVTLIITANKNVDWVSLIIEDENDPSRNKIFFSSTKAGCVDGTATCTKTWKGDLSHGSVGPSATFRVKVHIKDTVGHEYTEYLEPYRIFVP